MDQTMIVAYRACLDPTSDQLTALAQHVGANRWAYNYALSRKVEAHRRFEQIRTEMMIAAGEDPDDKAVSKRFNKPAGAAAPKIPNYMDNMKAWRAERGDEQTGFDGVCPWWRAASNYAFSSGMQDADAAFKNWFDSASGRRAGGPVGYPRFKAKGRSRDSYKLFHDQKRPAIRVVDARHVTLPRLGVVRLHSNLRRLVQLINSQPGQVTVRSATISREGDRWWVSLLVERPLIAQEPTRRQRTNGMVGADWGVVNLVTLSDGTVFDNPKHGKDVEERIARLQRKIARCEKGSQNRRKLVVKLGAAQARLAERRKQAMHQVTKRIATSYTGVAIETLDAKQMTKSAAGTVDEPGSLVKVTATFNRHMLDALPGEFGRQLDYKGSWYGCDVQRVPTEFPSSQLCSACGATNPVRLDVRPYTCHSCGVVMDQDLNAALNLKAEALRISRLQVC